MHQTSSSRAILSVSCSFILFLFFSNLFSSQNILVSCVDEISEADKPIPITHTTGILGHKGNLACDVRVPSNMRDDKLHMVLWFRDKDGEPIYRYDVRDRSPSEGKRWSALGDRIYFQTMSEPSAHLYINELRLEDEGVYRCRVDFKNSPTRNLRVNLSIIVPPEKPVIFNGVDRTRVIDVITPVPEGTLLLVCEVAGGRPRPKLTWWLENAMIDDSDEFHKKTGLIVNTLEYPIRRHHLNAKFVCQASNTHHSPPLVAEARVDLRLPPLHTEIIFKDPHLLADKTYEIVCKSTGSRPTATITWWKNNGPLKNLKQRTAADHPEDKNNRNVTKSIIELTPTIDDDTKVLTCRSENHLIPLSGKEDNYRLNVHYAPILFLQLGTSLNPDDIKENGDAYFECSIRSNPPHTKLAWFKEGRELRHNQNQGVIMSNNRLVLRGVSRKQAGNYTCHVQNAIATTQSNPVHLRVKYVPTCKSNSEELIGAMKHETVAIRCEMAADPPEIRFRWTFNDSGVAVSPIPQVHVKSNGSNWSVLHYTPTSEKDYGTLACWGSNDIGDGRAGPCYFQIVSAGKPFPPKNCSLYNETADSLSVACIEGFNGGLPQHFILEVVDLSAKKIKLNTSSKMPLFSLEGMEPGVAFRFLVFAVNSKGRSEPFILDGITFRGVAKYTSSTTNAELNPLFAILVGCSIVLIIFLAVTIIAIWKRSRRKKPPIVKTLRRDDETTFQPTDTTITKLDQNGLEEIGNPDVVPNKNGRTGGIRGFIRIHKTPPARRRKKDMEVKNNGEIVALTDAHELEIQRNHHSHPSTLNNHKILTSAHLPPKESRI